MMTVTVPTAFLVVITGSRLAAVSICVHNFRQTVFSSIGVLDRRLHLVGSVRFVRPTRLASNTLAFMPECRRVRLVLTGGVEDIFDLCVQVSFVSADHKDLRAYHHKDLYHNNRYSLVVHHPPQQ